MNISFLRPNYPFERRVALLPSDLSNAKFYSVYQKIFVEDGFGNCLGLDNSAYEKVGCEIKSREEVFSSDVIFSLKLIQESDYDFLRFGQKIVGWMHPTGSGRDFYDSIAKNLQLDLFDIDSASPKIYWGNRKVTPVSGLPRNFFWENSYLAGIASIQILRENFNCDRNCNVAVLGSGNVAQGSFHELSRLGFRPRMFYRKTLDIFYDSVGEFDVIVNGIEVDRSDVHIMNRELILKTKRSVVLVDAAADAGRSIEGTVYQTLHSPVSTVFDRSYILVNNAPSLLADEASKAISKVVCEFLLSRSFFAE